ncbi:MAG: hypothetical protein Kow00105_04810 [Phycisphaeraceae bacterium]
MLCVGSVLAQDAVKLSGFWIEPVRVRSISDGQVHYQTAAGLVLSRPFHLLGGLKLERFPQLAQAESALESGETDRAASLLAKLRQTAEPAWVGHYARMRLVEVYAKQGDAESAVSEYVDMVVSGVPGMFIARAPMDAVARADAPVRAEVAELLRAALPTVTGERAEKLKALIQASGEPDVASSPDGSMGVDIVVQPGALPLSRSVRPGSIVSLYRTGRFEQVLQAADEALSQPGHTPVELYLKGMALLALAERERNQALYKSAGLCFMRVVTYFPTSAVAGPSWLEAGYVHEKLGRTDIARRLYERARPLIQQDEDPEYHQRLVERLAAMEEAD